MSGLHALLQPLDDVEAGYTTCMPTTPPGSIQTEGSNRSLEVACHAVLVAGRDVKHE